MKLAELLPLINECTTVGLFYLSDSGARMVCRGDDTNSVIDCVREEGRNIAELTVVSVDADVYYFDDYDWDDYGCPELDIIVDGWEEQE